MVCLSLVVQSSGALPSSDTLVKRSSKSSTACITTASASVTVAQAVPSYMTRTKWLSAPGNTHVQEHIKRQTWGLCLLLVLFEACTLLHFYYLPTNRNGWHTCKQANYTVYRLLFYQVKDRIHSYYFSQPSELGVSL